MYRVEINMKKESNDHPSEPKPIDPADSGSDQSDDDKDKTQPTKES